MWFSPPTCLTSVSSALPSVCPPAPHPLLSSVCVKACRSLFVGPSVQFPHVSPVSPVFLWLTIFPGCSSYSFGFFLPRFLWICSHLFCLVLLFAFWRIGLDFGHLHFTSLTFAFCCFNRPVCFFHCVKRGSVVNVASVPITGVCTTPVRG